MWGVTMKKLSLLILFMFSLVLLASCSLGGSTATNDLKGKTYEFMTANITYGSDVTEEQKKKVDSFILAYEYQIKFNDDNTYEIIKNDESIKKGNYTYKDGVVKCFDENSAYQKGKLDGQKLIMEMPAAVKYQMPDKVVDMNLEYVEKR